MEPDFGTILFRVLLIGFSVLIVGTTGLYLAFRALGGNSGRRPLIIGGAAIAFILIVCAVLLRWSLAHGG